MHHFNAKLQTMESLPIDKILDTLNSSIICLDAELRIRYVNSTGEALFESSASSLSGKHFEQLFSRVEASTITAKLASITSESQVLTEHEAQITLANGKSMIADYSIYALEDSAFEASLLVEIKPLDRQVQIARESLSHLQKQASQQFARGMAHEIKNPLGGIRGAAQLLEREIRHSHLKEFTDVIISEVDRLQTLIDNMLGPNTELRKKPVNILEILEHIRRLLLAADPHRFVIHRDYDPSIPELLGDRDQLIQAFLNITQNAVQALAEGGEIIFKTRVGRQVTIAQTRHALVAQIDIIDNGHGIANELKSTIFLPMVTNKAEGSGLGLPIAQEIVSRHGGIIRAESSDSGTTISTILPLELR